MRRVISVAGALLWVASVALGASADPSTNAAVAATPKADQLVRIDPIQRLVLALYPELQHRTDLHIVLRSESQPIDRRLVAYRVLVTIDSVKNVNRLKPGSYQPFLSLLISHDEAGSIIGVMALPCAHIAVERSQQLSELAQEHGEWSKEEYDSVMESAGVKFGRGQAVPVRRRALEVIASLDSLFGGLRLRELWHPTQIASGNWGVSWVGVATRPGDRHEYSFAIDPFTGRVEFFRVDED